jgi:hypothetical protein
MKFKKSTIIASIVAFGLVCGAVGAGAATGIKQIKAALNYNLKFSVDGESWTPKDAKGNTMTPIVYNGSTYLPARAIGEALGASVALNGTTIEIETGNSGIPYNDANGSSSASNSSGGKSNGGSSTGSSTSSSGGVIKLSGTTASMEEKMRAEALVLIHLYGDALEEGSPDKVLNYIDKIVSDPIEDSPLSFGAPYYKEKFEQFFDAVTSQNDDDIIQEYADAMQAATLSEVETSSVSDKSEFSQSFTYSFYPEGFSAFSSVYIYFTFNADKYDSPNFLLGELRFG